MMQFIEPNEDCQLHQGACRRYILPGHLHSARKLQRSILRIAKFCMSCG